MPSPLAMLPSATGQARPQILYGQVSMVQPLPKRPGDPLFVVLPHRPENYLRVDDWPDYDGTLPAAGSDVVLAYDSQRRLRCVLWTLARPRPPVAPFCNKLAHYLLA